MFARVRLLQKIVPLFYINIHRGDLRGRLGYHFLDCIRRWLVVVEEEEVGWIHDGRRWNEDAVFPKKNFPPSFVPRHPFDMALCEQAFLG
ncbi:hypothetical protein J6590_105714 [Homalodisca vitripennis]|nr:hypothetical protein J6590_105714 [Homalodisca vitripennis]